MNNVCKYCACRKRKGKPAPAAGRAIAFPTVSARAMTDHILLERRDQMEALEKIREAEAMAAELKQKAKAAADSALAQAESDARRDADILIAKAKTDAAKAVAAAEKEAGEKAKAIRAKGEAENAALRKTASGNEANAVKLVLSKL